MPAAVTDIGRVSDPWHEGCDPALVTSSVLRLLKRNWDELRRARPGERFRQWHDKQQRTARSWVRPLYLGAAVVSLAVGIVLTVMPGPAVVFFALAGALIASQSTAVARFLDNAEVRIRGVLRRVRQRARRRRR